MAKQLNVALNFTAETGQAKAAIQELQQSLSKIAYAGVGGSNIVGDSAKQIKEASEAAKQLQYHLNNAFDATTGNFDLSKLDRSLQSSGTNIQNLSTKLLQAGQTGQQAFAQLARSISMADQPIFRVNSKLNEMLVTLKNTARWQISSSILHGFMGTLQHAYGYAQDLNRSLNDIRIVTSQSVDQMARFAEQANKSARALSTTTTEYTKASLIYYQQGLTDAEVKERTDVTVKMANVAGSSAQIVSDQMTAVWNNFDDGSKSLEYYADVMTALGAATASSTDEIAAGLEKFAAVSETVGLSYEYATAALATVTATTRQSADVVGNAFKTLFARIQGLNLGETLDDGTTLNKYSEALAKVGISIKDSNGQMKEMDDILDEMGAKWNTLDKSQQTALAQTVAGVRQYTQLVALMDNWDYFGENLQVALGSEGELQKQADIYAESWEAARDRVEAAAESIYSSLLDDKFFIDINNGFANLLSGIGEFVKGIGGAKGVIAAFGSIFLTNFAQKMPEAIQNLQYNITLLTKGSAEAYKRIQTDMEKTANKVFSGQIGDQLSKDSSMGFAIDSANQLSAARTKLSMVSNQMTEAEKQLAQMELGLIESQQQEVISIKQKNEALMEQINLTKSALSSETAMLNVEKVREKAFKAESLMYKRRNDYKANSNAQKSLDSFRSGYSRLLDSLEQDIQTKIGEPLFKAFSQGLDTNSFKNVTINLDHLSNKVKNIQTAFQNVRGIELKEVRHRVSELIQLLPNGVRQSQELRAALDGIETAGSKDDMNNALEKLQSVLTNCKIPANDLRRILSEIYGADKIDALISNMEKYREGVSKAETATSRLAQMLNSFQPKHIVTGIEAITAAAAGLGNVAAMINSIKSAFQALNNPDLKGWEKFSTVLMSVSMIIPMLLSGVKNYMKVQSYWNSLIDINTAKMIANKVALIASTQVQNKEGLATAAAAAEHLLKAAAIDAETQVTYKGETMTLAYALAQAIAEKKTLAEAIAHLTNTAAIEGETIAIDAETAAKLKNLTVSKLFYAKMLILVGVIAAVTWGLSKLITTQKEASEETKKANQEYDEAKQKLEELEGELKSIQDRIKELEEMDSLSIIEQTELDKLKEAEKSLQHQIWLQEEIEKAKEKGSIETIVKNWEKTSRPIEPYEVLHADGITLEQYKRRLGIENPGYVKDPETWLTNNPWAAEFISDWEQELEAARIDFIERYGSDVSAKEEEYSRYAKGVLSGLVEKRDLDFEKKAQDDLEEWRKLIYQESYSERFLAPLIKGLNSKITTTDLEDLEKTDWSTKIDFGELLTSGISAEDFDAYMDTMMEEALKYVSPGDLAKLPFEDLIILFNNIESLKSFDPNAGLSLINFIQGVKRETENVDNSSLQNLGKIFSSIKDLNIGDIIDEETFTSLSENMKQFFVETINGEYMLIDAAEKLKVAFQNNLFNAVIPIKNIIGDDLDRIDITDLLRNQVVDFTDNTQKWEASDFVKNQLEFIKIMGGDISSLEESILDGDITIDDLEAIAKAAGESKIKYDDLVKTYAQSITTLKELHEAQGVITDEQYEDSLLRIAAGYEECHDELITYQSAVGDAKGAAQTALEEAIALAEADEKFKEVVEAAKNSADEAESLKDELISVKEQIEEIKDLGPLSITQEEDLERLEKMEDLLAVQLAYAEKENKIKQQEVVDALEEKEITWESSEDESSNLTALKDIESQWQSLLTAEEAGIEISQTLWDEIQTALENGRKEVFGEDYAKTFVLPLLDSLIQPFTEEEISEIISNKGFDWASKVPIEIIKAMGLDPNDFNSEINNFLNSLLGEGSLFDQEELKQILSLPAEDLALILQNANQFTGNEPVLEFLRMLKEEAGGASFTQDWIKNYNTVKELQPGDSIDREAYINLPSELQNLFSENIEGEFDYTGRLGQAEDLLKNFMLEQIRQNQIAFEKLATDGEGTPEELFTLNQEIAELRNVLAMTAKSSDDLDSMLLKGDINYDTYKDNQSSAFMSQIAEEGFDYDEIETYSELLQENNELLRDNSELSQEVALAHKRTQKGVDKLSDTWEEFNDALAVKDYQKLSKIIPEINDALKDILNLSDENFENLSSDFAVKNFDLLQDVIDGVDGALEELQVAAAKDILINMGINEADITAEMSNMLTELANMTEGTQLTLEPEIDNANAFDGLYELLSAAGLTADQIMNVLDAIGWDPQIEYVPIDYDTAQSYYSSGSQQVAILTPGGGYEVKSVPLNGEQTLKEDTQYYIPKIVGAKKTGGGSQSYSRPSGNKGGGGGGKQPKFAEKKNDSDKERYHTLVNQLEDLKSEYEEIAEASDRAFGSDKLAKMDDEIAKTDELIAKQEEYLKAISANLPVDKDVMTSYYNDTIGGPAIQFDERGNISNFDEIQDAMYAKYNAMTAYDEESLEWQTFEKRYEQLEKFIEQYEETYDLLRDEESEYQDLLNQRIDLALEKVQYEVELKLNVSDDSLALIEFQLNMLEDNAFKAAEAIEFQAEQAEILYDKMQASEQGLRDILATSDMSVNEIEQLLAGNTSVLDGHTFTEAQIEAIREYRDNLLDFAEELQEVREEIQERLLDAFDEWNEKLDEGIEKFDHYNSIMENYKNMIDIVGKKYLKIDNQMLNNLNQAMVENNINRVTATKDALEALTAAEIRAREAYNEALARGNENDILYWKETLETIGEEVSEAQEEMMQAWEDALQSAAEAFEAAVEHAIENFEKALLPFGTLEEFSDIYEKQQDVADEFLDDYKQIYELSKLNRDINNSIDDTKSIVGKQKLKSLINDINKLQEEGTQLSEYDLEYLQKTYELRLAEIALEESQKAKDTVRLTRDNEGNWSYAYTSNTDAIDDAAQKYEDALYAMQDLSSEYIDEMSSQLIDTSLEMEEALAAVRIEDYASIEEYYKKLDEIQQYYLDRMNYMQNEMQKALDNNKALYEQDWKNYSDATGYKISSDDKFAMSYKDTVLGTLFGSESDLVDFQQRVNDALGDSDSGLIGQLLQSYIQWAENTDKAMDEAGTSSKDFAEDMDNAVHGDGGIIDSSNAATDAVNDMANQMVAGFDTICTAIERWQTEAGDAADYVIQDYLNVVKAYNDMVEVLSSNEVDRKLENNLSNVIGNIINSYSGQVTIPGYSAYQASTNSAPSGSSNKSSSSSTVQSSYVPAHIAKEASQSGNYQAYINNYLSKQRFASGGYTGEWGSDPRWALLDEKEIVLNSKDTENLLQVIQLTRNMLETIDLNAQQASIGMGALVASAIKSESNSLLDQQVHITAEFPNVVNHFEIEEALNNLINISSQYANRK